MGLLHKNLILAGIASVAMVGFLGSSSASALDGFSFSDVINNYRNQTEQLQSYLTNPFGSGCEATNPDSTISCNETSFPNLLYSASSKENLWGHDGKGIVFANNNNLVNGNPQLATANRGDTLKFSVAIEAENYYDDAKTDPITNYTFGSLNSCGLAIDESSAIVKVNNQVISADTYNVEFFDIPKEEVERAGYDFCNEFIVSLDWVNESDTPQYAEGSTIEFTFEAAIEDDAPSEVFGRGVYLYGSKAGHQEVSSTDFMTNTTFQATAMLDGNILIRRVDTNGNPLAGAQYTIDDVKASPSEEAGNVFVYNEKGDVSTFETGTDGYIVITNVPFGTYTVREINAPTGHETQTEVLTRSNTDDLIDTPYGEETFMLSPPGVDESADVTECIENLQNGKRGLDWPCTMAKFGTSPANLETVATWNEEEQAYTNDDGLRITKEGDSFKMNDFIIPYDSETGKYSTTVTMGDMFEQLFGGDLIFTVNNDDTATFAFNDQIRQFRLNKNTGCYDPVDEEETIGSSFCKDGNNYIAKTYDDRDYYIIAIPTDQPGVYKIDYDHIYLTVDVIDDDTVKLGYYFAVLYSEYLGKYLVALQSTLIGAVPLEGSRNHVMAAEYLFQDKTMSSPESIPNPQTSDAALKAAIIATIGLTPIFILRKQLTKRTN